jgi:hypothetical protein
VSFLELVTGLVIGRGLYAGGGLALCSVYLSWCLQIPPLQNSVEILVSSLAAIVGGTLLTKRTLRRYHLQTAGTSLAATAVSWGFFISGNLLGLWGFLRLIFPFFSNEYDIVQYAAVFTAAAVLRRLGSTLVRSSIGMDAATVLASDSRPPILYLRSYARESFKATIKYNLLALKIRWNIARAGLGAYARHRQYHQSEEAIERAVEEFLRGMPRMILPMSIENILSAKYISRYIISGASRNTDNEQFLFGILMEKFGPYIACMNNQHMSATGYLGAAKIAVRNDGWPETVRDLIIKAAAIVVELDITAGLRWEITEIVRTQLPKKLLLIVPRTNMGYELAANQVEELFPKGLPAPSDVNSRLVMFEDDWTPISLQWRPLDVDIDIDFFAELTWQKIREIDNLCLSMVNPFFSRLNIRYISTEGDIDFGKLSINGEIY